MSDRPLAVTIVALSAAVLVRLAVTAGDTGNVRGFWFSAVHTALVAAGTYLALREGRGAERAPPGPPRPER